MLDFSMLSRLWSLFDQAGPLANFLQIAGACLAVGGVVTGLFRRRLRRAADRIGLLERDVATREAEIATLSEQRDRLAKQRTALLARLPETAGARLNDERAQQAAIDDWIATEGPHVAGVLGKRADFVVRHAVGDGRGSALAMTQALCEAALLFDRNRRDLMALGAEAAAALTLENRIAPSTQELIEAFELFDVAESFDAGGVESGVAALDAALEAIRAGHLALAAPLAHQALTTFTAQLGADAAQTIDATLVSASLDLKVGAAAACLDSASHLADRLRAAPTHGADHKQTQLARFLTSLSLYELDRVEEALELARDIVADFQTAPTEDAYTPDKISANLHLVRCLTAVGETEKAIEIARKQNALANAELGVDHPVALDSNLALAQALLAGDCLTEAEQVLRSILRRAPLPDFLKELSAKQALAVCLARLGRYDEATPIARAIQKEAQDLKAPTANLLLSQIDATLADCLLRTGQIGEALRLAQDSVSRLTANPSIGPNHRSCLSARSVFANCLASAGREEEALREIEDVIQQGKHASLELVFRDADVLRAKLRAQLGTAPMIEP